MLKTFLKRSLSTVILITLFLCAIFLKNSAGTIIFSILAILLSYIATWEFCSIMKQSGHPVFMKLTSILVTLTAIFCLRGMFMLAIALCACVSAVGWILILCAKGKNENLEKVIHSLGIYTLFVLPISFMIYLYGFDSAHHNGNMLLLYLILITKIADIGAYVTGTLCHVISHGKNHKLIPSISPGKSWEGMIGGLVITLVFSYFLWPVCVPLQCCAVCCSLLAGVILFFGSMAGDLAESSFKRICGVKDSGKILPGIGGILDLVDSLMINTVLFWIFFMICSGSMKLCC